MKNNNESLYTAMYRRVYGSETLRRVLNVLDVTAVLLTALIFVFALAFVWVKEGSPYSAIRLIFGTGIPFAMVSLLRHVLNMPRPCEVFKLDFLPKKEGNSFPSRHVFSAFCIGTALCFLMAPLGIIVLLLGVVCAVCRVLLGNHFVRDVIAGALIGVGTSLLGMLIL